MRRLLQAIMCVALIAPGPPASASDCDHPTVRINHRCTVSFGAAGVPCAVACAHGLDTLNRDLDGDGEPDIYFDVCAAPFPPGSWEDKVITAPGPPAFTDPTEALFWFAIFPLVDYDAFVCSPDGARFGHSSVVCVSVTGANSDRLFGCTEYILFRITPGETFFMRVYNRSDVPGPVLPLAGAYAFCDPLRAGAFACAKSGGV